MQWINERTVELTPVEEVVKCWFDSLLDKGYGLAESVDILRGESPENQPANAFVTTMADSDFTNWLING